MRYVDHENRKYSAGSDHPHEDPFNVQVLLKVPFKVLIGLDALVLNVVLNVSLSLSLIVILNAIKIGQTGLGLQLCHALPDFTHSFYPR